MKEALLTLGFVFTFMGGFAYGSLNHYVDTMSHCPTYKQSGVIWEGYRAISDNNERRCFWLEGRHPYRVRQGVN
jgi:hypothetical protein